MLKLYLPKEARMFSRFRIAIILTLLFAFAVVFPVFAGGWAVITLDELPSGVVAGEPLAVGFTVLQHGKTPMTDLEPTVTASLSNNKPLTFFAIAEGKPGHYTATLTFPEEGNWEWSIQAFTMNQKMPLFSVVSSGAASVSQSVAKVEPAKPAISSLLVVGILAVSIGFAGLLVAFRYKSRFTLGLAVMCLLVGFGSLITESASTVEAEAQSPSKTLNASSISQEELGQQLFVAKGCITCHVNTKVTNSQGYWTIGFGSATNLSNFSAHPDVLRMRLKDPTLVKSDTQMPNLNLSDAEIEALVVFINSK
jgi:Cytochrome c